MRDDGKCDWQTGTALTGPSTCGNRAKWSVDEDGYPTRHVCGIHKRSALRLASSPVIVTAIHEATDA